MRGFIFLEKSNKLFSLAEIKNILARSPLNSSFDELFSDSEKTCLHQFLISRLLGLNFNKAYLKAIIRYDKKLYFPLPKKWREILENEGFRVNFFENRVSWFFFLFKQYSLGILTGLIEPIRIFSKSKNSKGSFIYLNDLSVANFPKKNSDKNNLINWVITFYRLQEGDEILHTEKKINISNFRSRKIKYVKSIIPKIETFGQFFNYFIWFFTFSLKALLNMHKSILFREKIFQKLIELSDKSSLPKACFFHNSDHIFRPLWTYVAEAKGTQILFYFYSTNLSSIKIKGKKFLQQNHWNIISWSNFLVWNQTQHNFIKKYLRIKSKITIVGIIPFRNSESFSIKKTSRKKILVFDTQPVRSVIYQSLVLNYNYFIPENAITFLKHIDTVAKEYNIDVFIKRKRDISVVDKGYLHKLSKLLSTKRWTEIHPDCDANIVIDKIKPIGSISVPYSSTAIITQQKNIPTIYYDGTSKIELDFEANNNIDLLQNIRSLGNWIKSIID